ncbi:MAG TPA: Gfo/Idh/MocA family oxidoreductase [Chthoniobacterales bacterium]|nr:Gfo/Idh/MocA family oxidoreductase [Chthoniobacterales bacterium]
MMPLLLGIIGCGRVTQQLHLPALRFVPAIKVAALADVDLSRVETAARQFPNAQRYSEPGELLADSELNAVAVCTPPQTHAELALAALAAGKHVLVEKPLALTIADGERMLRGAEMSNKIAAIGFNLRCHRLVRRAREMIASGALGEIHQMITMWGSQMQHDSKMPAWRRLEATGGGALFEIGIHHIDACAFLLGDKIDNVQMLARSGACDDESVSLLARTNGGVLISSSFSQVTAQFNEFRIVGDRGVLSFSLYRADSFAFANLSQPSFGLRQRLNQLGRLREFPELLRVARSGGDYLLSYREQWKRFAAAVRGKKPPASSFADGLTALKVAHAALKSREDGMLATVPD